MPPPSPPPTTYMQSVPLAFITCEMSSAFPENGGYCLWVTEAFGEFWGFAVSCLSWMAGVIDTAFYPVMAFEIVSRPFIPDGLGFPWLFCYLAKVALCVLWTIPNIVGAHFVGKLLIYLVFIVMAPYVVVSYLGFSTGSWENVLSHPSHSNIGTDWFNLLNTLFFVYSGFDKISAVSGEVENPGKIFPKALFTTMAILVVAYTVPLLAATVAGHPPALTWVDGEWATIALDLVS
jgi:amino acid transporter